MKKFLLLFAIIFNMSFCNNDSDFKKGILEDLDNGVVYCIDKLEGENFINSAYVYIPELNTLNIFYLTDKRFFNIDISLTGKVIYINELNPHKEYYQFSKKRLIEDIFNVDCCQSLKVLENLGLSEQQIAFYYKKHSHTFKDSLQHNLKELLNMFGNDARLNFKYLKTTKKRYDGTYHYKNDRELYNMLTPNVSRSPSIAYKNIIKDAYVTKYLPKHATKITNYQINKFFGSLFCRNIELQDLRREMKEDYNNNTNELTL